MSKDSKLGAALYSTESSFAETTSTMQKRLQILGEPNVQGLTQNKIEIPTTNQRPHQGVQGVQAGYGGSFSISLLLTGHGATAATTLTKTDLCTLLGYCVGSSDSTAVGTTADGTGNATAFGVNGGTLVAGQLIRAGVRGDGSGEGQPGVVSGLSGSTLTMLTAMPATPANTEVIYAMQGVYPTETDVGTVQSLRFKLMSANKQYLVKGCWCTSIEFVQINPGEQPRVNLTFACAHWAIVNDTVPDTTATDSKAGAPVVNGSLFLQDNGTATRQTFGLRGLSIDINMEYVISEGPGGANANQTTVAVTRFDMPASGTDTFRDLWNGTTYQQLLIGLSTGDGKALAFSCPKVRATGNSPMQEGDGVNRVTMNWLAEEGASTTAQSYANWMLGMG